MFFLYSRRAELERARPCFPAREALRPTVELIEDRLLPGETVLGGLLAMSLFGPGVALLEQMGPVPDIGMADRVSKGPMQSSEGIALSVRGLSAEAPRSTANFLGLHEVVEAPKDTEPTRPAGTTTADRVGAERGTGDNYGLLLLTQGKQDRPALGLINNQLPPTNKPTMARLPAFAQMLGTTPTAAAGYQAITASAVPSFPGTSLHEAGLTISGGSRVQPTKQSDLGSNDPNVIPVQAISKGYTEGLGRLPDPNGWIDALNRLFGGGSVPCNASSLGNYFKDKYNPNGEYGGLLYNTSAETLTLFRGILNREPDQAGFSDIKAQLDIPGTDIRSVIDYIINNPTYGFASLVPSICTAGSYSFGTIRPLVVPPTSGGDFCGAYCGQTETDLQNLINIVSQRGGGTVFLDQMAVVPISFLFYVQPGVTLSTYGVGNHNHYALMGRLVRDVNMNSTMVFVEDGAQLQDVWIDGERTANTGYYPNDPSVYVVTGNAGAFVNNNIISNTAGWTSLYLGFPGSPTTCNGNIAVDSNLITVYSATDGNTDGISDYCENGIIQNNMIVDVTDQMIVVFGLPSPRNQRSTVSNNWMLSAGNSAGGGITLDPVHTFTPAQDNFHSTNVDYNVMWTSPYQSITIAYGDTRPWFGPYTDLAVGALFQYNSTTSAQYGVSMRVNDGYFIAEDVVTVIESSTSSVAVFQFHTCPAAAVAVDFRFAHTYSIQVPQITSVAPNYPCLP